MTGPGALSDGRVRRFAESFGVAFIPLVAIVVARAIGGGLTVTLISAADLSFAMVSAAVVVLVQLLTERGTRSLEDAIPRLVFIVLFLVAFVSAAAVQTYKQEAKHDDVVKASNTVIRDTSGDEPPRASDLARDAPALAHAVKAESHESSMASTPFVIVGLLSLVSMSFLFFARDRL